MSKDAGKTLNLCKGTKLVPGWGPSECEAVAEYPHEDHWYCLDHYPPYVELMALKRRESMKQIEREIVNLKKRLEID